MTATVVGVPSASNIYGVTDVHANVAVASAIALDYAVVGIIAVVAVLKSQLFLWILLLLASPMLLASLLTFTVHCTVYCTSPLQLVFSKVLASILMLFAPLMFQLSLVLLLLTFLHLSMPQESLLC
jgi:hypothetical protein